MLGVVPTASGVKSQGMPGAIDDDEDDDVAAPEPPGKPPDAPPPPLPLAEDAGWCPVSPDGGRDPSSLPMQSRPGRNIMLAGSTSSVVEEVRAVLREQHAELMDRLSSWMQQQEAHFDTIMSFDRGRSNKGHTMSLSDSSGVRVLSSALLESQDAGKVCRSTVKICTDEDKEGDEEKSVHTVKGTFENGDTVQFTPKSERSLPDHGNEKSASSRKSRIHSPKTLEASTKTCSFEPQSETRQGASGPAPRMSISARRQSLAHGALAAISNVSKVIAEAVVLSPAEIAEQRIRELEEQEGGGQGHARNTLIGAQRGTITGGHRQTIVGGQRRTMVGVQRQTITGGSGRHTTSEGNGNTRADAEKKDDSDDDDDDEDDDGDASAPCREQDTSSPPRQLDLAAHLEEEEEEDDAESDKSSSLYSFAPGNGFHRSSLKKIVHGNTFEVFFGLVIVTNSIYIGIEVDWTANNPRGDIPLFFYVVGYSYTALFTVELILRLCADRFNFCVTQVKRALWNSLDVIIVVSSLFEIVLDIINFASTQDADGGDVNMSNLRIVRIIRITKLMRLFRIGRIVKFIRALRTLVLSIVCTLKAVFWSLLLMVIIIYVFSIIFTQAATDYIVAIDIGGKEDILTAAMKKKLIHHWGTVPDGMLSLFMSISGGVSWMDVMQPLRLVDSFWLYTFLCFIGFVYFAVLNVVTGVFCQSAIESTQHDQETMVQTFLANKKLFTNRFQALFCSIDTDGSGTITSEEFQEHINDEKVQAYFATLGLDANDAVHLFKLLDEHDVDDVGIDIEDFVDGCLRLKGTAKSCDLARLMYENKSILRELSEFVEFAEEQFSIIVGEQKKMANFQSRRQSMKGMRPIKEDGPKVLPPAFVPPALAHLQGGNNIITRR